MYPSSHRTDLGRAERTRQLVARLLVQVPRESPQYPMVLELFRLYNADPPKDISEILLRIPGSSHTKKAKQLGISKAWFSKLLRREHKPTPELAQRIAKAAGVSVDDLQ